MIKRDSYDAMSAFCESVRLPATWQAQVRFSYRRHQVPGTHRIEFWKVVDHEIVEKVRFMTCTKMGRSK